MTHHLQVPLLCPGGFKVEVDEGIAETLDYLWSEGVVTNYSCQGGWMEYRDYPRWWTQAYIAYSAKSDPIITGIFESWRLPEVRWEREDRLGDIRAQWVVRWTREPRC